MAEPAIYFSDVNERQGVFHRRAFLLGGFAGVGLAALGGGLPYVQLLETHGGEKLSARAWAQNSRKTACSGRPWSSSPLPRNR